MEAVPYCIALNDEGLRSWWGPRIVIKKAIEEVEGISRDWTILW